MKTKILSLFAALALSAGLFAGSAQAAENPFGVTKLDTAQQLSMSSKPDSKCGGESKKSKCGESKKAGKCGDGKTKKESKCGGN